MFDACLRRGHQLSMRSFSMAQDTIAYILQKECGHMEPHPNVVWVIRSQCVQNMSWMHSHHPLVIRPHKTHDNTRWSQAFRNAGSSCSNIAFESGAVAGMAAREWAEHWQLKGPVTLKSSTKHPQACIRNRERRGRSHFSVVSQSAHKWPIKRDYHTYISTNCYIEPLLFPQSNKCDGYMLLE